MSGSYEDTSGRSDSLNAGAAHDAGLYDPNRHDNQIVAVFEDRAAAERARDALLQAGIAQGAVQVLDRTAGDATPGTTRAEDRNQDEGFWGAIKSLFAPEEDYHAYGHAIDRGHAMVIVAPTANMDRQRAIEVLERCGPVDFDARLAEWRQAGYDYSGAARAGATTRPAPTGANPIASPAAAVSGAKRTTGTGRAGEDQKIEVVEERLRVGKREVAKGAVRVRSYVVERPVEEQVRLREETVNVDRQRVDRPVAAGDEPFQERTIEVRATAEEAVVSKEARVVEEIGVHKQANERTETVRDTIRETKVEVEDARGTGTGTGTSTSTGTGTGMGTGGKTTNATPGVTSSGMNSPRK